MLHGAGYATAYVGKYLNRYGIDPPHTRSSGNSLHYVPPGLGHVAGARSTGGSPAGSPVRAPPTTTTTPR